MFKVLPLQKDEIFRRIGHIAVSYKQFIIVWGGFKAVNNLGDDDYCSTDRVWMYNCVSEVWSTSDTSGDVPECNSGSTGVILDNYLYVYGGMGTYRYGYNNGITRLNLINFTWEELQPGGIEPLYCDKSVGWVYNGRLYFFGGYGHSPSSRGLEYRLVEDENYLRKCWNNQLISYDPESNKWSFVKTAGPTPSPRAAHACNIIGKRVFIFGGRLASERMNDLHILDMDTLKWSGNILEHYDGPMPPGLSWHSFTAVDDNSAVIYGGLNTSGYPNFNWWIFKLKEGIISFEPRSMPENSVWHAAAFSPETKEVIIIGGVTQSPYHMRSSDHIEKLIVLQCSPPSLFRESLQQFLVAICHEKVCLECSNLVDTLPDVLRSVVKNRIIQGPDYKFRLKV